MGDLNFDLAIFGTGLTESIVAAALSKWGLKVAHIDRKPYYGAEEASLTLDEFARWIDDHSASPSPRFSRSSRSANVPPFARQYSICLCPTIIPSIGPFIDALIQSGVSKYSGFRLLERVAVFDSSGHFKSVPGSKEDVFQNKELTLIQKRRLMRFLTFAAGGFEDSKELENNESVPFPEFLESVFSLEKGLVVAITYALAFCGHSTDSTVSVLPRIRRYLHSLGRYGPSPFLVGHYGGIGEIAQGFCRTAAVNGAVYILGREVVSITTPTQPHDSPDANSLFSISLEDIPEPLHARTILGSVPYLPEQYSQYARYVPNSPTFGSSYDLKVIARAVVIVEQPFALDLSNDSNMADDDAENADANEDSNEDDNDNGTTVPRNEKPLDTCTLVFPPGSLEGGSKDTSAVVLMTGEGSLSTPKGKYILYFGLPVQADTQVEPQQLLEPYVNAVLHLGKGESQDPLFTAFYLDHVQDVNLPFTNQPNRNTDHAPWLVPPNFPLGPLGDTADAATQNAELVFWEIIRTLRIDDVQGGSIWPKTRVDDNEDEP